ncbi:MAG: hypothetical protein C0486_00515 [Erythrobacter sp.]|nr:hypothetical protein [Erythrobacter sp.]
MVQRSSLCVLPTSCRPSRIRCLNSSWDLLAPRPLLIILVGYRRFIEAGESETEIALDLNARGVRTDLGREWTRGTVHQLLINEKYIGNNVWARTLHDARRFGYDAEDFAVVMMDELEAVANQIVADYNTSPHEGLGRPPTGACVPAGPKQVRDQQLR